MLTKTFVLAVAALVVSAAAPAGEIIIVDPSGAVTTPPQLPAARDAEIDRRTGADRARAWSGGAQGQTSQGTVVILPPGSGDTTVIVNPAPPEDARGAAREALRQAGEHAHGDRAAVDNPSGQAIIIIDDGHLRSGEEGAAAEGAMRAKLNAAKARGYAQGGKPCGSVVVGGIGESAPAAGSTATRDVYVLNSNCR